MPNENTVPSMRQLVPVDSGPDYRRCTAVTHRNQLKCSGYQRGRGGWCRWSLAENVAYDHCAWSLETP
jgi:hypothetical protein